MKISDYFEIEEFVPVGLFKLFGARSVWYFDHELVLAAELIRECLGGTPITINNWHRGGAYQYRGFRPRSCTVGVAYSMHRLGKAIDVSSKLFTPPQILARMQPRKADFLALGITTIENLKDTPTWLHLDRRPRIAGIHPEEDFLIVNG